MARDFGDLLYKELIIRGHIPKFSTETGTISENMRTLNDLLIDINITKSEPSYIEMEHPGSIQYLKYLLQTNHGIDYGLCPMVKIWKNSQGWQNGCRFDKGKGERMPVHCQGIQNACERKSELAEYKKEGPYER